MYHYRGYQEWLAVIQGVSLTGQRLPFNVEVLPSSLHISL